MIRIGQFMSFMISIYTFNDW